MSRKRVKTTQNTEGLGAGALVKAAIAARLLGLDSDTIRDYVRDGKLAGTTIGRSVFVYRNALKTLLDANASLSGPTDITSTIKGTMVD